MDNLVVSNLGNGKDQLEDAELKLKSLSDETTSVWLIGVAKMDEGMGIIEIKSGVGCTDTTIVDATWGVVAR